MSSSDISSLLNRVSDPGPKPVESALRSSIAREEEHDKYIAATALLELRYGRRRPAAPLDLLPPRVEFDDIKEIEEGPGAYTFDRHTSFSAYQQPTHHFSVSKSTPQRYLNPLTIERKDAEALGLSLQEHQRYKKDLAIAIAVRAEEKRRRYPFSRTNPGEHLVFIESIDVDETLRNMAPVFVKGPERKKWDSGPTCCGCAELDETPAPPEYQPHSRSQLDGNEEEMEEQVMTREGVL